MIYRFGHFELDMARVEFRARGEACPLEPQVFALLALLVENRERLVSRDEIIEKVGDGRIVSDAAVASRIKSTRQALGDDGKSQRYFRTVHRKGLRFVADVEPAPPEVAAGPAPAATTGPASLDAWAAYHLWACSTCTGSTGPTTPWRACCSSKRSRGTLASHGRTPACRSCTSRPRSCATPTTWPARSSWRGAAPSGPSNSTHSTRS
jgi:DNA-binding winged helix-turn-helix (wHTH) protein